MRLVLVAVGRLKAGPERELVTRYAERFTALGRGLGLSGPVLAEIAESAARRPEDRKAEEGRAIAARLGAGHPLILFDEGGAMPDSEEFAARLAAWRDAGAAGLDLAIGGADGLAADLRQRADLALAFGRMTLPHQLVRVLALEQLYRAATILAGHPYHRV
ncbi:23S rRNA (pseudouridine(1915)-N(3))-methyltransferase RlmH [Rhabdaerophilum calidifontis]|uniref:23S rRNA (pseudouridine(1915)-N(3))-methyltransferase RlmH n=1 Tax=Rhabdaerophilum calidifontis TaxID=2604328 RepID=UPI00123A777E|nr:23S rRNA (pseudouridine(1915)-N(3))-methyltransferase RlmH [Rhabdaerophilum calidifontis]